MRVRNRADYRTLVWAFVLFPMVPTIGYAAPQVTPWLAPLGLYLAYCAGIFTHNHNHCPVFTEQRANRAYAVWLSFFYGAPIFTWIPTHNQNHHRYVNGEGDATRTTRHGARNTLWKALSYPFFSTIWQAPAIRAYVDEARLSHPQRARAIAIQYAAVLGGHAAALTLAILLHGWALGATTYALVLGVPALFATWSMMFTNYVQHVDCDPLSPNDHSRNFVDPLTNWFVFDAGFHTVHHENPGVHWSRTRAMHDRRAHQIHPSLNEHSILTFCLKSYVLGLVLPSFRSKPLAPATTTAPCFDPTPARSDRAATPCDPAVARFHLAPARDDRAAPLFDPPPPFFDAPSAKNDVPSN